ncbi:putative transcription elongation factor SPT5 homolog 1 isoform X2 [Bidens hawaiensis]|uniref:putative transcription elongation factor SPT5 homolog 1 isoform X2 n=1 Tax=Bidens hawaiensis TaxID=980011 RepID=UPI004049A256
MAHGRDEYDDDVEDEDIQDDAVDEDDDNDEDYGSSRGGRGDRKRRRSEYIDDAAEEDEDEDEEEDDYDEDDENDEDYRGGGGRGRGVRNRRGGKAARKASGAQFLELEADVDSDGEEEDEDEGDDDFIVNERLNPLEEEDVRRMHRHPLLPHVDQEEDVEDLERLVQERFSRNRAEYDEDDDASEVDQQALLPSVRDPKLWMVKCAIGHEREVAVCLMQKCIDRSSGLQIRSAIALDHLKNYIYIEADKEAHVKEACKGLRNIYTGSKILLVPIKEMTDVLSVESKAIEVSREMWVRMKIGTYKGDLAKEGREVQKKKAFTPPQRFMIVDEAREMHIRVERRWDAMMNEYFDTINGMKFKDGFLYKPVSMKSIRTQNIQPSFDELEKFRQPDKNGDVDIASLSALFANRKKGHFMKGDRVIVIKGDLKNLKGWVEKVEEGTVHIKPNAAGLLTTLAVSEKELCKYFEPGNHVKVVTGAQEGVTGMVVTVAGHLVNMVSDTTKDVIRVFSDNVVESSEVTSGITKIGDFELHDLVQLDHSNFGVIIRLDSEAFQVLKGAADKADVQLVRLRDIKYKIDRKVSAQDRHKNTISVKDVVKVLEGPCKGRQGPVEHINRGILFIYDRHHMEHAGFICAKSQSCVLVGGSRANGDRNGNSFASRAQIRPPTRVPHSPGRGFPPLPGGRYRGGRGGKNSLVGTVIKVRVGPFKGYRGRVVDVNGTSVRVELESQMKVVTVDRSHIFDSVNVTTPNRDTHRYGSGSETPMHPSRTPLHPYQTPMRDVGATPIHDGMRTPMRDRAWNPYAPMSPPRDSWEDGNPGSWGSSSQYQPGSPRSKAYEAPTPGSGWANTPGCSYSDADTSRDTTTYGNAPSPYLPSTPGGPPPMTPSSAYLPGTPGGQPMTPGSGGLDMMSPAVGGDNDGPWFLPDILVNVRRAGEDAYLGVIREVLLDGGCRVALGTNGNGEVITASPSEIEVVVPRKSDKIKILGGAQRGVTGKLIGVDGTDGIVKVDDNLDVKILDMVILAKLAHFS